MLSPLHKRFARDLKRNYGKYLGLFAMIAVSIAILSGFLTAAASIEKLYNNMAADYAIEDGQLTADAALTDEQQTAAKNQGVSLFELFSRDISFTVPDTSTTATMRLSLDRTEVDLAALAGGTLPARDDEIAINRNFAAHYNLDVGSVLELDGRPYTVSGIVTLPDYTAQFSDNNDFTMDTLTFCTAIVTAGAFDDFANHATAYTYAFAFDQKGLSLAERSDKEADLATALAASGARLSSLIDAEANQGITYAGEDVAHDQAMFEVLLLLLIAIMAFIFVILTGSTIEEESAIIGTLLASGYRKGELLRHYSFMPFALGLLAAIAGNVCGFTLLSDPMRDLYYNSYSFPPYVASFSWRIFTLTTVVPLVLLWGITLAGLALKLRATPLQFLRHEVQHSPKRAGLRLPATWRYLTRFRLRVIVRNLPHFATMFCGILLSSLILLFGLAMMPVVENYASSLASAVPAEHVYVLKAPLSLDATGNDEETINQAERLVVASLEVPHKFGGQNETVTTYGVQESSRYFDIDVSDDRIVVGAGLAQKCALQVGGTVSLYDKYADTWHEVAVAGLYGDLTNTNVYASEDTLNNLACNEKGYFNAYASDKELTLDQHAIASEATPAAMEKVSAQLQDSMGDMVGMMQGLAVFVFFVVMYLLTKTVIERNARQIAYLKVFGYRDGEIRSLYVRAITLVVLVSLVVSLPLVMVFLNWFCEIIFMGYSGNFPLVFPSYLLAIEVGMGAATYLIVAALHLRRIHRVPMALALKVQE